MDVGIVAKTDSPHAAAIADRIVDTIRGPDVDVVVDEATAATLAGVDDGESTPRGVAVAAMATCDLVVSIGGDGTFLFAARAVGATPILGVNLGEVGFLNVVAPDAAIETVERTVERYRETGSIRRQALTRVRASGIDWTLPPALNEVAVLGPRRGPGASLGVEVRIDGELYGGGRADGVLVATPTGSTAYNLAAGGPLVVPTVSALAVAELAAAESMPPLVVDAERTVSVHVAAADRAVVVGDGRTRQWIDPPTTVTVETAATPAHIAGPPLRFFRALGKLD